MKFVLLSAPESDAAISAIRHVLGNTAGAIRIGYLASSHEPDRRYYRQMQTYYQQFGADLCCYVDLEQDFSLQTFEQLCQCDVIHLAGGDTYRFLKGVQERKVAQQLCAFSMAGGGFIGLSAGAMLLCPSIESATLCGDQNGVELSDMAGLQLIPYQFIPHIDKTDNGVNAALAAAEHLCSQALARFPAILCADDDAVIFDKGSLLGFGSPLLFDGLQLLSINK
ncbi:Type 1 glutamine amidotransferase-like domain-containing protein [Shewanella colwelliana]|uniref:Type 1 glutamine amidotransferase-like domain-containing protein n=1 Tax=Shewanella colwelliana TaxID=23 RepID=UPI0022B0623A|nr:Type 1 glutamine amidotransferase-like domain-containing protein [Shewanella colwelliana]MCZ4336455.1 Type 1 glutamine amidotransferase-like domain-containing protein [Shewanella colwelliana]